MGGSAFPGRFHRKIENPFVFLGEATIVVSPLLRPCYTDFSNWGHRIRRQGPSGERSPPPPNRTL
ncbi:hypothetical protein HMPREF0262_00154 [Clostridium sp. ATCC 29733]|nr:hypothetical protein HMPREF0262_00154 [Clostridium sp. ATCC 29733]